MKAEYKTLHIFGESKGDSSVGIGSCEFDFDTGLSPEDVDESTREWLIKRIVRDIWELHDNGDLCYEFSDEWEKCKDHFHYRRRMTWEESKKILREK